MASIHVLASPDLSRFERPTFRRGIAPPKAAGPRENSFRPSRSESYKKHLGPRHGFISTPTLVRTARNPREQTASSPSGELQRPFAVSAQLPTSRVNLHLSAFCPDRMQHHNMKYLLAVLAVFLVALTLASAYPRTRTVKVRDEYYSEIVAQSLFPFSCRVLPARPSVSKKIFSPHER